LDVGKFAGWLSDAVGSTYAAAVVGIDVWEMAARVDDGGCHSRFGFSCSVFITFLVGQLFA
jgi:hypothetical protein